MPCAFRGLRVSVFCWTAPLLSELSPSFALRQAFRGRRGSRAGLLTSCLPSVESIQSARFPIFIEATRGHFPSLLSLCGRTGLMRPPARLTAARRLRKRQYTSFLVTFAILPAHFCQFLFAFSREHHNQPRISSIPIAVLSTQAPLWRRAPGETLRLANRACLAYHFGDNFRYSGAVRLLPPGCPFQRRSAALSGEASIKIFSFRL